MKRWLGLLVLFFLPKIGYSAITDPQVLQEKTMVVHLSTTISTLTSVTTSTFLLVSLSTTAGIFPHMETGEIDINQVSVVVDKIAASSGTLRIGVVTFLNTSTGTVKFFYSHPFLKNVSNTDATFYENFSPSFYRCKVISGATSTNPNIAGTTPYIGSNETNGGSSIYNSTSTLPSPLGFIIPRVGDIVMEVINNDVASTINLAVDLWYHSER